MSSGLLLSGLARDDVMPEFHGAEIHTSDISAFLACRRAWDWSSRLRKNLEPKRMYAPFYHGRAVHYCMERWFASGEPFEISLPKFVDDETKLMRESATIWEQDRVMVQEQTDLAYAILTHYLTWEKRQTGPFAMKNLEFITHEQEFKVPIVHPHTGEVATWGHYAGKLDGLARRKDDGSVWIIEYKTAKAVEQRAKMLVNDAQAGNYLNAVSYILGEQVHGLIYTIMAKRAPKPVKILSSGMLSVDLRDQTTESYLAAIRKHHATLDENEQSVPPSNKWIMEHYGAQIIALDEDSNKFFERHVVTRNEAARRDAALNLWNIGYEMVNPSVTIYPTPGFLCSACQFKEPCIATQNGTIADMLLSDLFRLRNQHAGSTDADVIE